MRFFQISHASNLNGMRDMLKPALSRKQKTAMQRFFGRNLIHTEQSHIPKQQVNKVKRRQDWTTKTPTAITIANHSFIVKLL